jgi:hypothetical protein
MSNNDRACIFLVLAGYFSSNALKNLVAVAAISPWLYSFFGPAFLTGGISIVSVVFMFRLLLIDQP